jgi:histidinol dehydrogenase
MTRLRLRFTGSLSELDDAQRRELFERATLDDEAVILTVSSIIEIVRRDGDDGLAALAREFDGAAPDPIEVPGALVKRALDRLDPEVRRAMERSIANLETVHRAQVPTALELQTEPGVFVGQRPDVLGRVGIYAPGGRSPYASSVLMGAVPARVAGVGEVILCTPADGDGRPAAPILAAAALAGVQRVFSVGGAGAIAAMAFGTRSVPRVDRIVGPGNAWVTEAKAQVSRVVGIDMLAGPSELLVLADEDADMRVVAREMVAQAEHDSRACVLAIVIGSGDAAHRLVETLNALPLNGTRRRLTTDALASRGGVLTATSLPDAILFANDYAPEHLLLALRDPEAALARVRNAGTVCLGEPSSVTFGDYVTGSNHVLPTGGLARSASALSTAQFFRWTSYQRVTRDAARNLAPDATVLASVESLEAHARAAAAWGTPA